MNKSELERSAFQGEPIPDGLPLTGQRCYLALCALYASYRAWAFTKEQAAAQKANIYAQAAKESEKDKLRDLFSKTIHDTEAAREEYIKNRTLENADKLIAAFEHLQRK